MIRKLLLLFLLISQSLYTQASHITGGELRYEFNGTNYTVYVRSYILCNSTVNLTFPQTINFVSSSCNDSFQRMFAVSSIDTITDMWCPGIPIDCNTSYQPIIAVNYIDTVSLSACSNWRIGTSLSALTNALDNMGWSPGSYNIYLESLLDNSMIPNSNALILNHPPFRIGVNTVNTIPLQAIDADGDSVAFKLEELHHAPNWVVPFGTGYSADHQMGDYTILDNGNQRLAIGASIQNESLMVLRIEEYRNGTLISAYNRVWQTIVRPFANQTIPLTIPSTEFSYASCPGQANNITLNFIDSAATDSIFINFQPPSIPGITFTTSTTTTPGTGSGTISWTTPSDIDATTIPYFIIPVYVRDNNCPDQGYANYGILVKITCFPLAIALVGISAENNGPNNIITWETASEEHGDWFEIERSEDGKTFESIYKLQAKGKFTYSFTDDKPITGTNYYRIKLSNASKKQGYSEVVTATVKDIKQPFDINVYPNPTQGIVNIKVAGGIAGNADVAIIDIFGKTIYTFSTSSNNNIAVNMDNFQQGTYFVKYNDELNSKTVRISKN